jgi:hypothetical protein
LKRTFTQESLGIARCLIASIFECYFRKKSKVRMRLRLATLAGAVDPTQTA